MTAAQTNVGPGVDPAVGDIPPVPGPTPSPLAAALARFQAELPRIEKGETAKVPTKDGGSYSYTYADLATVSAAVEPLLGKHGLSFTCWPTLRGERLVLAYYLLHEAGERMGGEYPLGATGNAQQVGSAITYARRYCLCAVTGVAPEDDDDDAAAASVTNRAAAAEYDSEMRTARDDVRGAWQVTFGKFDQGEAEKFYKRWMNGAELLKATPADLRRFAAYLHARPAEDAGADPNTYQTASPGGDEPGLVDTEHGPTGPMKVKLHALLTPIYGRDRQQRLAFLSQFTGRPIKSSNELTYSEAHQLINELEQNEARTPGTSSGAGVHAEASDAADGTAADQTSGTPRTGEPAPDDQGGN